MRSPDERILLCIYGLSKKNRVFCALMKWVCKLSSAVFFLAYILGAVWSFVSETAHGEVIVYFAAPASTLGISYMIRFIVKRKRPHQAIADVTPFVDKSDAKMRKRDSLPSNHSTSAAAIALALLAVSSCAGIVALAAAALTGLSRVAVGLHYLGDVLAGFVLAAGMHVAWMQISGL